MALQAAVCFAQRVIGHARQQMMQGMIAQADRGPQRRTWPGRRHIDCIEILRGHRHRLAVILPQMRHQRANLIEYGSSRDHRQTNRQRPPVIQHRSGNQENRPQRGAQFLPEHHPREIALRRTAAEIGIDRERRGAAPHEPAQRRDHYAQRYQHCAAHQQRGRQQQRNQCEAWQRPRFHERERQILRILRRAIAGARVVQRMDPFIHEGGGKHRNADQQIPDQSETGQCITVNMGQLVDEQQRPVKCQRCDDARHSRQHRIFEQDRPRQCGVAGHSGPEHIRPIDTGAGFGNIARQLNRCAQHDHIVRNSCAVAGRFCAGQHGAWLGRRGFDGLVGGHASIPNGRFRTSFSAELSLSH